MTGARTASGTAGVEPRVDEGGSAHSFPRIWLGPWSARAPELMIGFWGVLAIAAVIVGATQDYPLYMEQWQAILAGQNPWRDIGDGGNVYGPGHNAFALLYWLDEMLPKLSFVGCWIWGYFIIARRTTGNQRLNLLIYLFLFGNPFFIFLVGVYGSHDIFVALLILAAVDLRDREERRFLPALLLAAATLTKFYPVVVVPFLATRRRAVDWAFLGWFVLAVALGVGIASLIWETPLWNVLRYAATRPSKLFSIWFFLLESELSPVRHTALAQWISDRNTWILGAAMTAAYLFHWWARMRPVPGAFLAILTVFTVYKVGELQFFLPIFLLLIYLYVWEPPTARADRLFLLSAMALCATIDLFLIFYLATEGGALVPQGRAFIGLPVFFVSVLLAIGVCRLELAERAAARR